MSDLSNGLQIPDDSVADKERPTKPAVMLITMVLLISALLLTGAMLLYYSGAKKQGLADSHNTNESTSGIAAFFKSMTSNATTSAESDEASSGSFSLFGNGEGNVRWPKLKLTGYGTRPDGSGGFAIINGHQYQVGQMVNGKVTIIEVREHDVLVEYAGETNSLIVDVNR